MKILRNYVLKELSFYFFLALSILTFILVLGNLIKLADMVINKDVELTYVIKLFFYLFPSLLSYTLPMAILTAVLLVFGRLAADNELTAIKASGISVFKIFMPVIVIAIIVSLFSLILNNEVLPKARFATRKIVSQIGIKKPKAFLEAGTFIKSFKNYIIFIGGEKNNKFSNITIYEPKEAGTAKLIIAKKGEILTSAQKNSIRLKLTDVISDEPNPADPDRFIKMKFKTYHLNLKLSDEFESSLINKKLKDSKIKEIKQEIFKLKKDGININPLLAEMHRRLSLSFASFVFVLIGLPLAIITKRPEKSIGFGLSLCVVIVYYVIMVAGQAMAEKGILLVWFDMWLANIIMSFAGLILISKVIKR